MSCVNLVWAFRSQEKRGVRTSTAEAFVIVDRFKMLKWESLSLSMRKLYCLENPQRSMRAMLQVLLTPSTPATFRKAHVRFRIYPSPAASVAHSWSRVTQPLSGFTPVARFATHRVV